MLMKIFSSCSAVCHVTNWSSASLRWLTADRSAALISLSVFLCLRKEKLYLLSHHTGTVTPRLLKHTDVCSFHLRCAFIKMHFNVCIFSGTHLCNDALGVRWHTWMGSSAKTCERLAPLAPKFQLILFCCLWTEKMKEATFKVGFCKHTHSESKRTIQSNIPFFNLVFTSWGNKPLKSHSDHISIVFF